MMLENHFCARCSVPIFPKARELKRGRGKFCSHKCVVATPRTSIESRFWEKVVKTDSCWLWVGAKSQAQYGQILGETYTGRRKRNVLAHRASYIMHFGPIPAGIFVCHACDTKLCVRPNHLFLGTRKDNAQDAAAKLLLPYGEKVHNVRLTESQVLAIRSARKMGVPERTIAAEYGISRGAIGHITHRRTWKHLP